MQTICIMEDSIVTRVSLAAVAAVALIGAAACKDAVTSPENSSDSALRYRIVGNPPPPPIDTGANGSFTPATTLRAEPTPRFFGPQYSIFQSASPTRRTSISRVPTRGALDFQQTAFNFNLPITYFFNKTSNDGYVHFSNDPDGVNSSSNGMVTNHGGVLSGKGTLTIETFEGTLIIDLSSLVQQDSFLGCSVETTDAPTNNGGVCFHFSFSSATLNGVPGSVDMRPGCSPEGADSEVNACPTFSD